MVGFVIKSGDHGLMLDWQNRHKHWFQILRSKSSWRVYGYYWSNSK